MSSPADAIPDLERLMRNVLRDVLRVNLGDEWLGGLSKGARDGVDRAAETARSQRPNENLRDPWEAVGIGEIGATLRSTWDHLGGALADVWKDAAEAKVDLDRLRAYRGKNLHAVGSPEGKIRADEAAAIVLRLRVGFEGVRRQLAGDQGEWWPYIEAVHSNIAEFCYDRSRGPATRPEAKLVEGDTVQLDVVAVHPTAPQERLRYKFGGRMNTISADWTTDTQFALIVPNTRDETLWVQVGDVDDLGNSQLVILSTFSARPHGS
jgi:hypothetical protein